jgi:uracil-DNA glycosylase family 4
MDDLSEVIEELKRHLKERRRSGLSVIHRLDQSAGTGGAVEKVKEIGGGPAEPEKQAAQAVVTAGAEGAAVNRGDVQGDVRRSPRESERKGTSMSERERAVVGAGSIRYRHESRPASQADLFGDGPVEKEPDLSGLDMTSLEKMVSTCTRCHLSRTRTNTVFGSGARDAGIVFIGEAPGRDEDLQGLPFVGRAGKLLTKILDSVGMSRDEVYITNILKCRPPENRDPQEDEVKACEIYLGRQIELIDPVLICALGRIAGQNLLKCNTPLATLRQNVHFYNDTKVIVAYHPAALLRNPNLKRAAWEDIKMIRRMYDEELESR